MNIIRVSVTFYCLQTNLLAVFSESCYSERSRRGFVLVNTTYNYSISDSFPSCIELCFNEPSCMSLNFWWDTKKCDLNNSTRENCRACFAEEPSSIYMGMGRYPGMKRLYGAGNIMKNQKTLISLVKKFSKKAFGRQIAAFDE